MNRSAAAVRAYIRGSQLVVLPDGGHSLQVTGAGTVWQTVTELLLG